MTRVKAVIEQPGGDAADEVPNWSPWLRHCRGQHGRTINAAERRAAWEAEAARHRAITAEYGGAVIDEEM